MENKKLLSGPGRTIPSIFNLHSFSFVFFQMPLPQRFSADAYFLKENQRSRKKEMLPTVVTHSL